MVKYWLNNIQKNINFLLHGESYSVNYKVYFYVLNLRFPILMKLWYLVKVIKDKHCKTYSLLFILLGWPQSRDLDQIRESDLSIDDRVKFIFYLIRPSKMKNHLFEKIANKQEFEIVHIKYLRILDWRNVRKVKINLNLSKNSFNLGRGGLEYKKRTGLKVISFDSLHTYEGGEVYLSSELFKSKGKYFVKMKKDSRIKNSKFNKDKMILGIKKNFAVIRKNLHFKEVNMKYVSTVSSGMSYHFGHFMENDLMGIRFNVFGNFKNRTEIELVLNMNREKFNKTLLGKTEFKGRISEIPSDSKINFEKLFLTNKPLFIGEDFKIGTNFSHRSPIVLLNHKNNRFFNFVDNGINREKIVGLFLTRKYEAGTRRKIKNRDKIFEIVESHGIKIVNPAEVDLEELNRLILSCQIILTEWGSPESNLKIFEVENKRLIHFTPNSAEDIKWGYPAILSKRNQVNIVVGEAEDHTDRQSNFEIDVENFRKLFCSVLEKSIHKQ